MSEENKIPALRKGNVSINKKNDLNKIKPVDTSKSKISKILKSDSIQKQMNDELKRKKGLDLVLIGDFTDSMSEYREKLRLKFKELSKTLFKVIDNLRIGIIFYLDHGTGIYSNYNPYVTRYHKLTTDIEALYNFIDEAKIDNGIDWEEAVEDALNDAYNNMNWNQINAKSIVLFGDARPHEPRECIYGYDYFELTKKLYQKQVTINTVFCNTGYGGYNKVSSAYKIDIGDFSKRVSRLREDEFFSWIANVTGGIAIGVEQIEDIVDIIQAMAAKDAGKMDEYEEEIKKTHKAAKIPILEHIKKESLKIEEKKKTLRITGR
ncbi:VWA domain-containing protein [uncultured Brachyspira sp.]|uniref:VWA domain-containing protein n=1 Tax=uncultured Brachyspira sp. TaxID=221953 RepID=UPI0026088CA6|nr:VWA domain-containing protein [uncultured Brachyspira sp.]